MQLGEGLMSPAEYFATADELRLIRSWRRSGKKTIDVRVAHMDPDVPYLVFYPARDVVEVDAVLWKLGVGRNIETMH